MELEEMVKKHENLIWFVIHRNKFSFEDEEDLYSIGMIGLIKGIRSYDKSKGKESSYLYRCIYNEIACEGRKQRNRMNNRPYSLDFTLKDKRTGADVGDLYDTVGECDSYHSLEVFDYIKSVMVSFSEIERLCFTECILKERNQRDVAKEVGLSQSYVSRVLIKALAKVRKAVDSDV